MTYPIHRDHAFSVLHFRAYLAFDSVWSFFSAFEMWIGRHQRCKTSAAVAQSAKSVTTAYRVVDVQLSLPLLAPLGVGFTMVIWKNASLIFPRICFLAVFLYVLWFLNSVVQNTVLYLRRQVCFFLL